VQTERSSEAPEPTSEPANVPQQPQSQPDPSTKRQQESPPDASAITDAIIADHERKHHVSPACSSLAVLGHLIAQERDSGVSIEDTRSRLDDIKGGTPKYRAALYSLIDSIYAHPEDSFETVEANITVQCGKSDALTTPQTAGPNTKQQLSKKNKLAAGAWYLLMPPLNSHLNPINEATLPQWYQDFAFDSAKACEATKLATLDQLRRTLHDPTLIAGFVKDRAEHLAEGRDALTIGQTYARTQASLCVSADDPRLVK
jgi:hypothetical protein